VSFKAVMAVEEKKRISERTKAGLAVARKRSVKLGRSTVDVDFRKLQELRSSGLSVRAIGKLLNVSHSTVATRLQAVAA
jgi:DNA invertase Pin-like site-specific DNA recombinase